MPTDQTNEAILAENEQLRRELRAALGALKNARDLLISAQEDLRKMRWALVEATEGLDGKHSK